MNAEPMVLPWTLATVPHAVLDILRGCNVRCRDCFNSRPNRIKPLQEVQSELKSLMRRRKLHSVAIVGGEITLHPELTEIVRMVRGHGLHVELFTNGVELTSELLANLAKAGAEFVILHIETGQKRPDLVEESTVQDIRKLRTQKARMITDFGMEAGLAVTLYPGKLEEAKEAVEFTLASPHVTFLLATLWRDVNGMPKLVGNLEKGIRQFEKGEETVTGKDDLEMPQIRSLLEETFGLTPFASVGSNLDENDERWLSYLVAAVHSSGDLRVRRCIRPTKVEKAFLEVTHKMTGRYPFFQNQKALRFALHLLLNGLAGGAFASHAHLLSKCIGPAARLSAKRLVFQSPAKIDNQGRLIYCHCCPDAVLADDGLVPLCISDLIS